MYNKRVENILKFKDINLPTTVEKLLDYLSKQNFETYIIGGFVRDLVLGKTSKDIDFVIVGEDQIKLSEELASKFNGKSILLDKETKTVRLVIFEDDCKNYSFDFTGVESTSLEEDFKRRDFTINALAINLKNRSEVIDKFGGLVDLKEKKIKPISLKNLTDDPLRFLRAFRFASAISGEIDEKILEYIKLNLSSFNDSVAIERVMVEFWKILDNKDSYKYIKQCSEVGLLEKIFPELTPCKKVPENDFHHLGLYDHSIHLLETYESNFSKIPDWAKEELRKPFGDAASPTNNAIAKFGSIFHDVGKPDTWEIKKVDGGEKHTFIGHDKLGAEITKKLCERLKLSNAISKTSASLVRYHLRPFQLSQHGAQITNRALFRFFRDVGDDMPLLLILALADHHATLGPKATKEHVEGGEILILSLFDEYKKHKEKEEEKAKRPKLLNGNDVMEITGLSASPKLGDLMKGLDEAISIGEIQTKEEAVSWIKNNQK